MWSNNSKQLCSDGNELAAESHACFDVLCTLIWITVNWNQKQTVQSMSFNTRLKIWSLENV